MTELRLTSDIDEYEFKCYLDGIPFDKLQDKDKVIVIDHLMGIRDTLLVRYINSKK